MELYLVLALLALTLAARALGFGSNDRIDDQVEFRRQRTEWKAGRGGPIEPLILNVRIR